MSPPPESFRSTPCDDDQDDVFAERNPLIGIVLGLETLGRRWDRIRRDHGRADPGMDPLPDADLTLRALLGVEAVRRHLRRRLREVRAVRPPAVESATSEPTRDLLE